MAISRPEHPLTEVEVQALQVRWLQFYEQTKSALWKACLWLTHNKADAEDLFDDVHVKLGPQLIEREKVIGNLTASGRTAYAIKTAYYAWWRWRKKQGNRYSYIDHSDAEELERLAYSRFSRQATRQKFLEGIKVLVSALKFDDAELLDAVYVEKLDYNALAPSAETNS